MTKHQTRKKMKVSKNKNIDEEPTLTNEELNQALSKSTEVLTKQWSEFADTHLDAITGVTKQISELKELAEKSAKGAAASSSLVPMQPDTRQWLVREHWGQVKCRAHHN